MSTFKKMGRSQINVLMMQLETFEKQKPSEPRISKWEETIKIRTEINEVEMKNTIPNKLRKQKVDTVKMLKN